MRMPKNRQVDIAIFIPSLAGGGAERVMVALANGFSARGLEVDLVLAHAAGSYLAEVSSNVCLVDLKCRRVAFCLPGLIKYFRAVRPSAMLSALSHVNVIAVLARLFSFTPTRLAISERATYSLQIQHERMLYARILTPLMRWAYPKADVVVAVSQGVADDLVQAIGLPAEKVVVAYNPVVTPTLIELATESLQHPWVTDGAPPVVLGVGRLSKEKDFSTLIKAFAKVHAQRACRLVILGEGDLRGQLEALIAEKGLASSVQLLGFVDNPFAWMQRATLFVLSSVCEGLPNALIQAMACGTSVVSTDCPSGPMEILEGGRWGRLVPVGDVDAMAAAIDASLDETLISPRLPDVVIRAQNFGQDQSIDKYLDILRLHRQQ